MRNHLPLPGIRHVSYHTAPNMGSAHFGQLFGILALGAAVRWVLFQHGFTPVLGQSYELVTPITSMQRLSEGLWLADHSSGPYTGSSYHNVPLLLPLLRMAYQLPFDSQLVIQAGFIAMDVICALTLFLLPWAYKRTQSGEYSVPEIIEYYRKRKPAHSNTLQMITPETLLKIVEEAPAPSQRTSILLAAMYMLNPFSIASCVAMSTQLPLNMMIFATALFACSGNLLISSTTLACSIYMSPYLLTLIIPVALILGEKSNISKMKGIMSSVLTLSFLAGILVVSYWYMGGELERILEWEHNNAWLFLDRVYGFQFFVEDLQPNIGISWYFFTEVFQHFRLLFLFVFQYHVFIYTIPVCYKLQQHPMATFWLMLAISSAFKSYPSVSDIVAFVSLFPMLNHLTKHMSYKTLIVTAALACTFLLPVMWRMWIWTGTGNANFYFAICVGIAITNGLLITDTMESILVRDFLIKQEISNDLSPTIEREK